MLTFLRRSGFMPFTFFTDTAVLWQNNPVCHLSCVLDFVISFYSNVLKNQTGTQSTWCPTRVFRSNFSTALCIFWDLCISKDGRRPWISPVCFMVSAGWGTSAPQQPRVVNSSQYNHSAPVKGFHGPALSCGCEKGEARVRPSATPPLPSRWGVRW